MSDLRSMLGDLLYELNDIKIINQRILDSNKIKIEFTIRASSNFRGTNITETTTFWTMPIESNKDVLYGEAKGVVTTHDRQGLATFRGHGLTLNWEMVRSRIEAVEFIVLVMLLLPQTNYHTLAI